MIYLTWYSHSFKEQIDEEKVKKIQQQIPEKSQLSELPFMEDQMSYCIHSKEVEEWQLESITHAIIELQENDWITARFNSETKTLCLQDREEIKDLLALAEKKRHQERTAYFIKKEENFRKEQAEHKEKREFDPYWRDETLENLDVVEPIQEQSNRQTVFDKETKDILLYEDNQLLARIPSGFFPLLENEIKDIRKNHREWFSTPRITLRDIQKPLRYKRQPLASLKELHLHFYLNNQDDITSSCHFAHLICQKTNDETKETWEEEIDLDVDLNHLFSLEEEYNGVMSSHEVWALFSPKLQQFIKENPSLIINVNDQIVPHDVLLNPSITKWYDIGEFI